MAGQAGKEAGPDERRFAAARGPVEESDRELVRRPFLLDPALPEADAFWQAIAVAGASEQFEEEVAVMLVEGTEPLGNDPDMLAARMRGRARRAGLRVMRLAIPRRGRRGLPFEGARGFVEELTQIVGEIPRGGIPVRGPLRHRLQADPLQLPGEL